METCEYFTRRWSRRFSFLGETTPVAELTEDTVEKRENRFMKDDQEAAPAKEEQSFLLKKEDASSSWTMNRSQCGDTLKAEGEGDSSGECPQVASLQLNEQDFCSYLTRHQWAKLIEETKPQSRVMDLEDNPPMFQDYNVGPIKLLPLASRTTKMLEQSSHRKRMRSRVLDLDEPEKSSKTNAVASKTRGAAPKRPRVAASSRTSEKADATLRHTLLGNANNHLEMNAVAQKVMKHPQYYPDTQTDGVLSSIQMEHAWLCEESLHCFGGSQIQWSFVYKYASEALKRELRDGTQLVCEQVAEATAQKRKEIRFRLRRGYRRPIMAASIAFYRLGLPRGVSAETASKKPLLPTMEKPSESTIVPTKKPAMILPVERLSQKRLQPTKEKPADSSIFSTKKPASILRVKKRLQTATKPILTESEAEIAWLLEESMIQNVSDGLDYMFILANASPTLRTAIERHSYRWLPRLVRLHDTKVKAEFELRRAEIRSMLYSGHRRPETKAGKKVKDSHC